MFDSSYLRYCLLLLSVLALGCDSPPQSTPDGVVRTFVERLTSFRGNARDADQLFELMSERARDNLNQRAERYSAASGRKIAPARMLVPARFAPGVIRSYKAQLSGKFALVEVVGTPPDRRAQIPCVLEKGQWRIDIVMPLLAPLQRRPHREP
jgi:hypothetical protein